MNKTWRAMAIAMTAATGTLDCGDSASGPAWSGAVASVSLEWTINGAAASTTTCHAVGGEFVALWAAIADPGCSAGSAGCGDSLDSWLWDCSAGTAQTGLDFRSGSVWLTWALLSADGTVRERTSWQQAELATGNRGFRFDFTPGPVGTPNAAIVTTWTLDGAAADAASCTAAGAETVRLVTRITGAAAETPQNFPCQDGSASTGNNYRATQRYDLRWELLDASGTALAPYPATGWQTAQMLEGDNPFAVDFPAPETGDAWISAVWGSRAGVADASSCTEIGAATVRATWRETGTTTESTHDWPCADGTGSTAAVLHAGTTYDHAWDLLDPDGASLSRVDWAEHTTLPGENAFTINFPYPDHGPLDVTLQFANTVPADTFGPCEFPTDPVETIGYRLEDSTTHEVFAEVDIDTAGVACPDLLSFTDLPFGTMLFTVDGRSATGTTATWHAECGAISISDWVSNVTFCQVPMITP